ncbi:GAF domain-containing protein [Modestobacter sp. DSM 44400]|uniref:GAF domain-containing protein n=1 Tax=Modestobacter sp. DSM 44400 TaxID=1550230 RepID=UPI000894D916|nr:GAF domain-containing protein [Modestobacter sp. DSM 44400]SDY17968.1 GAF domain-containing protein [Modestobacter sp. DSM 44400]
MGTDDEYELPTWAALPAQPHEEFDALARTLAERLSVPMTFVVLVSKGGQVFPGAYGLPARWDDRRSMPLSGSPSQQIARTGRSMAIRDIREVPVLRDTPILRELKVAAYAGAVVPDPLGRPLGVLCAIDVRPRDWSADDLAVVDALAAQCGQQLQRTALELAERESRAACERAATAAQQAARAAQAAFEEAEAEADRARLVARLGTALLASETLGDVLRTVDRLVRSPLGAIAVVLGLAEAGSALLQAYPTGPSSGPGGCRELNVEDSHPLAVAVRERRLVTVPTRVEADWLFPGGACPATRPPSPCWPCRCCSASTPPRGR